MAHPPLKGRGSRSLDVFIIFIYSLYFCEGFPLGKIVMNFAHSHPPEHLASPTINEIKGGVKRSGNNSVRLKKGSSTHKSKIIKVNLVEKVSTTHE